SSKTTAYYFQTKASGSYSDGIIMDDGRTSDESWDGVWYQASKVYEDKFEIEMQIPFHMENTGQNYKPNLHYTTVLQ
ncbi:unnamed protein product, partial [marine sediment metagenome]